MKKSKSFNRIRLNNKGAAMVVVLVVIGLVSVLASMVMYMSYANYVMKINESGSKVNFYSAETVLDQINSGLQIQVSKAVGIAYEVASQTTTSDDQTARETSFKSSYKKNIVNALKRGEILTQYEIGSISSVLDATGFYSYLDNGLKVMALNYDRSTGKPVDSEMGYLYIHSVNNEMTETTEGIVLRNLVIEFCDDEGYYSEIHTDILLAYPDITMATQYQFPEIDTYAIIADGGVDVSGETNSLKGNLYVGNKVIQKDSNHVYDTGLMITSGTLKVEGNNGALGNAVVRGDIHIKGRLDVSNDNLWTDGIELNSGKMNVYGTQSSVYNADDLTINGSANNVMLEGSYIGYGNGTNHFKGLDWKECSKPDLSSSIIANCKNSNIDLSNLTNLYLAGSAYLNPYSLYKTSGETKNLVYSVSFAGGTAASGGTDDIVMGNSVAVKVDQLAYLIPRTCIGYWDESATEFVEGNVHHILQNPMTQSEYDDWKTYIAMSNPGFTAVDYAALSEYSGFSLNGTTEHGYRVVAKQTMAGTMYYVYLTFKNPDTASAYYQAYVSNATDKLDRFAKKYNNTVKLPNVASTSITSVGNMLSCQVSADSAEFSIADSTVGYDSSVVTEMTSKYAKSYETWYSQLTADTTIEGLDENIYNYSAYENLIEESQFAAYDTSNENNTYEGINGIKALVTTKDVTIDHSFDIEHIALVITTGNVTVSKSFNGLILAGGHVTVKNSIVVQANEQNVQRALMAEVDADNNVASAFFKNGENYAASINSAGSSISYTNVKDLISYQNWSKQ